MVSAMDTLGSIQVQKQVKNNQIWQKTNSTYGLKRIAQMCCLIFFPEKMKIFIYGFCLRDSRVS